MHTKRKRKLWVIGVALGLFSIVVSLVLYALRQNISLFYTPTQIALQRVLPQQSIRIGGMVVKGSIERAAALRVQFKLTDFKNSMMVQYQGILPDLFREGQGVVVRGKLVNKHLFMAQEVLAKHDANYMPPELKSSLIAQQGKNG